VKDVASTCRQNFESHITTHVSMGGGNVVSSSYYSILVWYISDVVGNISDGTKWLERALVQSNCDLLLYWGDSQQTSYKQASGSSQRRFLEARN
jgi:hypothetical protein